MLTNLATLPLRLSLRLATRVARETYDVLGKVLGESPREPAPAPRRETPEPAPAPRARPRRPAAAAPAAPEPTPPAPAHVSAAPVLVDVSADAGAEDGAGAQLRIAEPFAGYAKLTAGDVIDRLETADAAELGAIQLYEGSHRARRQVLDAVQERLTASSRA